MRLRIPRSYKLPFGYSVKTRLVSRAQLDQVGGSGAEALWRVELRTIYILKELSKPMQLEKWLHELDHVKTDWRLWVRQQFDLEG